MQIFGSPVKLDIHLTSERAQLLGICLTLQGFFPLLSNMVVNAYCSLSHAHLLSLSSVQIIQLGVPNDKEYVVTCVHRSKHRPHVSSS